ncbi:hypothetical protein NRF20_26445 [Streptomyces sp. R-74717]|uniref:hypothetical protein n=1 Tax=Streptomyces sp. R-74717 TaxID=2969820 RepID=UPI0039B67C1C
MRDDDHRARPYTLFPRQQVRPDKRDVLTSQRVTVHRTGGSLAQDDGRRVSGHG